MNTAEHIVDCYFRLCRNCFTRSDVKILGGNNRQIDLLAVNLLQGLNFHVETTVTHSWDWFAKPDELLVELDRKFFGIPLPKAGEKTDHAKRKIYRPQIEDTYRALGIETQNLQRVYCLWCKPSFVDLDQVIAAYSQTWCVKPIEILSFRDTVLPELEAKVGTANYEDEVLRTLSLQLQRKKQVHLKPKAP